MRKKVIKVVASLLVICVSLWFLQALLVKKYVEDIPEGSMIAEYYSDDADHDVVFVGDCELYENISPQKLWDEYGINSYIRGSAQQLIWQSYYLMEDTLRYEKPDVFVFNVLSMKYGEPQNEGYNRMSIDGMKWSMTKVNDIMASMKEEESFIEYVFPILRYHSRWSELSDEDWKYLINKDQVTYNGYYMRIDSYPVSALPTPKPLVDYQFSENSYYYLDKMVKLCEENGVELVLVKAPSLNPVWYDEWEEQIEDYAKEHDLKYYNFLESQEEIGLDWDKDTYDGGLHLNLSGAEKMSSYFGNLLAKDCGLANRHGEEKLESAWDEKREAYDAEIERQKKEYIFENGVYVNPKNKSK